LARFRRGIGAGSGLPWFNARMMPIRADMVGPPSVATRIKASVAACHSAASCSAFGSFAQDVFVALYDGSLKREDVRARVRLFMLAENRMFPTKYAKFAGRPLLSLDEQLFDDGSTTRGDTISRGLWD
jgi:hypothetical protein